LRLSSRLGAGPVGLSGRTSSIVRRLKVDSPVFLERNGCVVWSTADADAMTTVGGGGSVSLGFTVIKASVVMHAVSMVRSKATQKCSESHLPDMLLWCIWFDAWV